MRTRPPSNILKGILLVAAAAGLAVVGLAFYDDRPRIEPNIQARRAPQVLAAGPVRFVDVTGTSGIRFKHNSGAFGAKWIAESLGGGAAFFDYDGDGDQDLFLANGRDWTPQEVAAYKSGPYKQHAAQGFVLPPNKPHRKTTSALYRNNGSGVFEDVTRGSGLDIEAYCLGTAIGDYDNDGRPDLLVTGLTRLYLFRNEFRGTSRGAFREVAAKMGMEGRRTHTSAAFVDYNRDGRLDVFACRYVKWAPAREKAYSAYAVHVPGQAAGLTKGYSGPRDYEPDTNALYRNRGASGFEDVSRSSGIEGAGGRAFLGTGLGVAVADVDRDGWPDLVVANDFMPNFLFRNRRDGTFEEVGVQSGVAYGNHGNTRAGMGIDTADIDGTGKESIVIGNYTDQVMALYQPVEPVARASKAVASKAVLFRDMAKERGIEEPMRYSVTFGLACVDVDNDGRPDIFAANGHVRDDVDRNPYYMDYGRITHAQRPSLLWNRGPGRAFQDIGFGNGKPQPEVVGRGLASADIDGDGDVDVVITCLDAPPLLLRNDGGNKNNALRLTLQGARSNRSAIGARVEARVGKSVLHRAVRSGSSYLSQNELPLTLGLGRASRVSELAVFWPSGATTRLRNIQANRALTIREGQGILSQRKLRR